MNIAYIDFMKINTIHFHTNHCGDGNIILPTITISQDNKNKNNKKQENFEGNMQYT